LLSSYVTVSNHQPSADAKQSRSSKKKSPTYGYCRYADDFLITAKTKVDIEAIIPVLHNWLKVRGLELNWEKTQVVSVQEGCNFLGFTIRHFKQRCLCRPQKEKVKTLLKRIRDWLRTHPAVTPVAVIHFLNPILRGWGNYYKHGASKAVFSYVDSQIWKALWRWCRRRHPNKGSRWIARKYYRTLKGRNWTFVAPTLDRAGNQTLLTITRLAEIPIQRHVKVKGTASPDDPSLRDYWYHRHAQLGKTYWEKGSKYYRVAQSQQWQCPICNAPLFNGEPLHTHHRTPFKQGGTNLEENLIHLHKACHQQVHSRREFCLTDGLSRLMG
jgi:RNA-directed DNA polymerase